MGEYTLRMLSIVAPIYNEDQYLETVMSKVVVYHAMKKL